jgi:hypothetical protein
LNNHEGKAMSSDRYEEIRARSKAARPGPWVAFVEGRDFDGGSSMIRIGEGEQSSEDLYLSGDDTAVPAADFDFIAHARQDIDFLLGEIDRLKTLPK